MADHFEWWSPVYCLGLTTATESSLDFLPVTLVDCSPSYTRQHHWSTASVDKSTWHRCSRSFISCLCQNAWISNSASWCIAVFMISDVNISRRTSGWCPRFILARVRPTLPTSWFLPHTGPHMATAHFRSQEQGIERVTAQCHPASSLSSFRRLLKTLCSSDNCINNINYCVLVLKCLHSAPR